LTQISLPGQATSDPTLVVSGPGQLELTAVTTGGTLYYTSRRDSTWINTFASRLPVEHILPQALDRDSAPSGRERRPRPRRAWDESFRPLLIATGPGQAEIISRATDGVFWHLRRINGEWRVPVELPHQRDAAVTPLRDPVAVWSGNRIELFYV